MIFLNPQVMNKYSRKKKADNRSLKNEDYSLNTLVCPVQIPVASVTCFYVSIVTSDNSIHLYETVKNTKNNPEFCFWKYSICFK
jgi:hypothetical protein